MITFVLSMPSYRNLYALTDNKKIQGKWTLSFIDYENTKCKELKQFKEIVLSLDIVEIKFSDNNIYRGSYSIDNVNKLLIVPIMKSTRMASTCRELLLVKLLYSNSKYYINNKTLTLEASNMKDSSIKSLVFTKQKKS
jgi:hypothetical protein